MPSVDHVPLTRGPGKNGTKKCELSLHAKFQGPCTSHSGRKVTTWKKEREMNDENNGYLLYVNTSRARAKSDVYPSLVAALSSSVEPWGRGQWGWQDTP